MMVRALKETLRDISYLIVCVGILFVIFYFISESI